MTSNQDTRFFETQRKCMFVYDNGETCGRPAHTTDADACFWHSKDATKDGPEVKMQLEVMSKNNESMEGFELQGADLQSVFLIGANLKRANLTRANLTNGHLYKIDLAGATLFKTIFIDANLKSATLRDSNVLGARFDGAKIEWVDWGDDERILTERDGLAAAARGEIDTAREKFLEAEEIYREIKNNYKNRGLASHGGRFFYREMVMKRYQLRRFSLERINSKLLDLACGYGEKPFSIIGFSVVFIFVNAIIFGIMGLNHADGVARFSLSQSLVENSTVLGNSFYFSVVTFTTLGYGDFLPITVMARLLSSFEAYVGAFLMALFVITVYKNMMER